MPESPRTVPVRLSAEDLNQQIRDLVTRADGRLSPRDHREYQRLVVAWAAASRGEVIEAA
ncbi:hypothetical protein [Streptomyces meridianus]|uniref:Uncharacterized protein n=1 Tax=Streptomyces meridianus TaxID=2938945 RepID=A0ABT0X5L5_9ACTN|nr:hypothetical protein [Streptomyces meridianus]MCM2577069.1 hypothetical protein [Streptomyces meridianus]